MSIVICDDCERQVDSDIDTDCFVEEGNMRRLTFTITLCENCRERRYDNEQERLMSDGPGPSLLDQQIAAMKFK